MQQNFLKTITIIHLGLVVGASMFLIVTLFLNNFKIDFEVKSGDLMFFYLVPLLILVCVFFATKIYTKLPESVVNTNLLQDKLELFQRFSILKFALIEGTTLFSILAFLITSNFYFWLLGLILVIYLWLQKPSRQRIFNDLNLSKTEQKIFNQHN